MSAEQTTTEALADTLSEALGAALDAGDALAGAAETTAPKLSAAWYACMEHIADLQKFQDA
jgi:hypothetical protein